MRVRVSSSRSARCRGLGQALTGDFVDAVHLEVEQFADPQAATWSGGAACRQLVRRAAQRLTQAPVGVDGKVAGSGCRQPGDVAGEDQLAGRCLVPAPGGREMSVSSPATARIRRCCSPGVITASFLLLGASATDVRYGSMCRCRSRARRGCPSPGIGLGEEPAVVGREASVETVLAVQVAFFSSR